MSAAPGESSLESFRVCFVCTGNICRSPMAETIARTLLARHRLTGLVTVESAATGDWHVGEPADARSTTALTAHGYPPARTRARQFDRAWFSRFDLVIAFDRGQERILREWAPTEADRAKVHVLGEFDPVAPGADIPDPYYSDPETFDRVLEIIERGTRALISQIEPAIRQGD